MGAWLGLVPAQHGSGGKTHLLGMSKRGDPYLRTLLVHGARAVIGHATRASAKRQDPWLQRLLARRGKNVAAVALANRNARIVWAMLAHGRAYDPRYHMVDADRQPYRSLNEPIRRTWHGNEEEQTTLCSSEQQLMATQVGPGLGEPAGGNALQVRGGIEVPTS